MGGAANDIWAMRKAMERCVRGHKNLCNVLFTGTVFARSEKFYSGGIEKEAAIVRSGGLELPVPGFEDAFRCGVGTRAGPGENYKNRNCYAEENMMVTAFWLTQPARLMREGTQYLLDRSGFGWALGGFAGGLAGSGSSPSHVSVLRRCLVTPLKA